MRNAGQISSAYTIVICDEAHTALGEKTSAAIREWTGPIFIGMTATGALIARHVTDLFPTQTSRFDLAQAARRGVIAPLRCIRIPPGPGVRTIAKVPLRKGEVDVEFDQEMLAELLDQAPFNLAIADLYKTRFNGVPGVVYTAGVRHAYNVAEAFRALGIKAEGVSGETPKRELAEILARYEAGEIDVLVNAQLLAEGWNSPARDGLHAPRADRLAPDLPAARRPRHAPPPGQGGRRRRRLRPSGDPARRSGRDAALAARPRRLPRRRDRRRPGPPRPRAPGARRAPRDPGRRDEERRHEVFERELWRIAVEHLDYGEQHMWAALAGARVQPSGWRRARAMLHFDRTGELKRRFLLTAVERNKNSQLRIRALQEIAALKDPEAFDLAFDLVGTWARDERREGTKVLLQALAEKRIGRRDQANAWIWRLAEYTREVHEEYAVQRWPETKRLLGLLVNSSGDAHARNARRLVQATRNQDRRLQAAILAAAVAHTPEAEEVLRGARTRLSRKPGALSRELLRNFPKGKGRRGRRRKKRPGGENGERRDRERRRTPASRSTPSRRRRRRAREAPRAPAAIAVQVGRRRRGRGRLSSGRRRRPAEVDLAGLERGAPAVGQLDDQPPRPVDAGGRAGAAGPGDRPPAQRVGLAVGGEQRRVVERERGLELAQQPLADRGDVGGREAQRRRGGVQLRRQVGDVHRDVHADPEDRPALLRAALGEDARRPCGRPAARRSAT